MTEPYPDDATDSAAAGEASAPAPRKSKRKPKPARAVSSHPRPPWLTWAALATALIAAVLAVIGWFRPSDGIGSFSDAQAQEAKQHICAVTGTVRNAVTLRTSQGNPVPDDPVGGVAVAANARLVLYAGGGYLLQRLAAEPATPADLRNAVTEYAETLQELGINYLAGAESDSAVQEPLREKLNEQREQLNALCQ